MTTALWRSVWHANVGESIARHSTVLKCEKGKLTVAVDNGSWLKELDHLKSDLISKFNHVCGRRLLIDLEFIRVEKLPTSDMHSPPEKDR